jgi:hypothetical protein
MLVLLTLGLTGCLTNQSPKPAPYVANDRDEVCDYLKNYLVVAKPTDDRKTREDSRIQIDHYKACK